MAKSGLSVDFDLRAEIIAGLLQSNGKNTTVYLQKLGIFKRNYSKDVEEIQKESDNNFLIKVNREGFYDMLPEDLFHFEEPLRKELDFTAKTKRKREQESSARKFFAPFENQLFDIQTIIELIEKQTFESAINEDLMHTFFEKQEVFEMLSPIQKAKLNFFFPLAYKFRGKVDFIEYMFCSIFQKEISCLTVRKQVSAHCNYYSNIGDTVLGVDSIVENFLTESTEVCQVTVNNLKHDEAKQFMPGEINHSLIIHILRFFIVEQMEVEILINFAALHNYTSLGADDVSYLGYNTILP